MKRSKDLMLFGADENQHIFKGLLLFLYVYIGASLFASIFTPLAFWLVEWVNTNSPCQLTEYLMRKKITIYYDRLRWLPIVISLPLILKACGLLSFKNLGIAFDKQSLKVFAKYWLFGAITVCSIFIIQAIFVGVSERDNIKIANIVFSAISGSLILGFLEEIVFRGLLMRNIYTAFGCISGIILSSLFFAYKHFKVPSEIWKVLPDNGLSAEWYSGFVVCYYDTIGIGYNFQLIPFLSLFVFGVVLCVFYIKTKSLQSSIAFHAGTVCLMMGFKKFFKLNSYENQFIFGNEWITNGCIGLGTLCLIFIISVLFIKSSKKSLL
ncbi:MAG: CPBP family intramembrane metalloprotease [Verrucomicrobiaceae bacterium]|nr:CPBP family intramembrane metalloprotease [Verrucomicrobiaceae bacterium]